ncbi:MAG TPA: hypothetical protein VJT49_05035 [Amycolatopsis sp.]|uniref:hypothetical protein n=1 Tax=Amycolatopsis sp. TaxID=37632 RepID=UPI002B4855F0|nr:hypothetical protein [Amycolatopsis sp.]HKS44471.1 hypothetical protein [Amycolatopsis sp.]
MIPAGERWGVNALAAGTDSGLRPCVEDHLGAGAIVEALLALSCSASPEATLAATAFAALRSPKPSPAVCPGVRP